MNDHADRQPLIGVTTDIRDGRYACGPGYADAIVAAGGTPVLMPPIPSLAAAYVDRFDGIVFTGGLDPDTRAFGQPLDPRARLVHPQRQAFETALLKALDERRAQPVLGVCLGMQMMSLHAGGRLEQYLPDVLTSASNHQGDRRHLVVLQAGGWLGETEIDGGTVVSSHQQAVAEPGRLQCVARSEDGVIEAVADSDRPFYVGVQWHPERAESSDSESFNRRLIEAFVTACRRRG